MTWPRKLTEASSTFAIIVISSPNFLVFENFYYVSSAVGVKSLVNENSKYPLVTTPKEIENAAQQVCGQSWEDVGKNYPMDDQPKDNNIKW